MASTKKQDYLACALGSEWNKALLMAYELKPLGFLESCFKDKFGTPRQPGLVGSSTAKLKLRADLQPEQCLQGLEGFSHVWLIFWFHLNQTSAYHAKVHPPRLGGESLGLFATRTPHRPNPLGLSLVRLDKIEKDEIFFSGVDLVDGTPIMDLKPYIPEVESLPLASSGWTQATNSKSIAVEFSAEALQLVNQWQSRKPELQLTKLIVETIQLDPRPLVYRGFEGQASPYRQNHAIRLHDGDVHFSFLDSGRAQVTDIRFDTK